MTQQAEPTTMKLSKHMDKRFEEVLGVMDKRFEQIDKRFEQVDRKFEELLGAINVFASDTQKQFNELNQRVGKIEIKLPDLVTVDYLDDRLADLRGDLVSIMRAEDNKFVELVVELQKEGKLKPPSAHRILAMQPFPHRLPA